MRTLKKSFLLAATLSLLLNAALNVTPSVWAQAGAAAGAGEARPWTLSADGRQTGGNVPETGLAEPKLAGNGLAGTEVLETSITRPQVLRPVAASQADQDPALDKPVTAGVGTAGVALAGSGPAKGGPEELKELRAGRFGAQGGEEQSGPLRERALREAALGSAIQAGARWRYERILKEIVGPREKFLDELFDFAHLVTDNGKLYLIPPVAASAGEAIRLSGDRSALGQDGSYSLVEKARLSGIPPDWRHYLMELPQGPAAVHEALRPKGATELKSWKKEIDRGWKMGVEQANRLFDSNVAALTRDYVGMMIFKRLVFERYARESGTQETITDLEVKESEIVFKKTLYQLVGQEGFVAPDRPGK